MREQGRLAFEYELDEGNSRVTAFGGLPMVAEILEAFGVNAAIREHVKLGRAQRRFDAAAITKAVVLTMAAGGECIDDAERLREDSALQQLLGAAVPAAETIRQSLYEFHDSGAVEAARETCAAAGRKAYVPAENAALAGLAKAMRPLVAEVQRRWPTREATVDIDATIEESHKREALPHYLGGRGYQPQLAVWVEQDLIVRDEFRDGNVPAHMNMLAFVQGAFESLPESVKTRRCRGDQQLYSPEVLQWLASQGIEFAVAAQVREPLGRACAELPEQSWDLLEQREDTDVHVALVEYAPRAVNIEGLRYIGVRMTPRQSEMFDNRRVVYLAIATTRPGNAREVVRWFWGKAGTIEHAHDVVKNELGGGVPPCGRFGANAAWFRMATLTYNVLSVLRKVGPDDLRHARPKRLRYQLLTIPTTLISHARQVLARTSAQFRRARDLVAVRDRVWLAARLSPA